MNSWLWLAGDCDGGDTDDTGGDVDDDKDDDTNDDADDDDEVFFCNSYDLKKLQIST